MTCAAFLTHFDFIHSKETTSALILTLNAYIASASVRDTLRLVRSRHYAEGSELAYRYEYREVGCEQCEASPPVSSAMMANGVTSMYHGSCTGFAESE